MAPAKHRRMGVLWGEIDATQDLIDCKSEIRIIIDFKVILVSREYYFKGS